MKKIIYIIFIMMLLIPFGVRAEDELSGMNIYISGTSDLFSIYCPNTNIVDNTKETTCTIELLDSNKTLNFNIEDNSGVLTFNPTSGTLDANNTEAEITIKASSVVGNGGEVNPGITIEIDGEEKEYNPTFYIGEVEEDTSDDETTNTGSNTNTESTIPTNPTTPENTTKPTTSNNKTTNKEVKNPNTSDSNVLLLSVIGILLIFTTGLSIKKLNLIKR